MITLFLYDITSDRIRGKIAKVCQDYGLKRIQYSAFLGDITANKQEELWLKCRRRLAEEEGNLMLFVLSQQDLARSRKYISKVVETQPALLVEPLTPPLLPENRL